MTNLNLTSALKMSLKMIENEGSPERSPESPLVEADPDAINQFLEEINADLVAGMPERITDQRLSQMIDIYRAKALHWEQEQEIKKTKTTRTKKPATALVLNIDLLT